ncbi:putative glycosyltransferase [Bacillus sp. TS-2]|nr:putative glycosyltransferase [Bacillus sp. TS-2]
MPKLSVIMPVYNNAEYLEESIQSILSQTFTDFEFLIINDGSTDYSLKIIEKYGLMDKRIKVINQENKGVVSSLNEAIVLSNSPLIARMDGDDIAFLNRFEKQINFLNKHPEVSILGTKIEAFGNGEDTQKAEVMNRYGRELRLEYIKETILRDNVICHPSVMMRREFVLSLNMYRDTYKYAEDYDLWMRAVRSGYVIQNLQETLLKYRLHANSIVGKNTTNFNVLRDLISIRLDFLLSDIGKENFSYLIWGAGSGGEIVADILKKRLKNGHLLGFVDSFKKGSISSYPIFLPEEVDKLDFDFCFLATTPGKGYAEQFLMKRNLKPSQDFYYLV